MSHSSSEVSVFQPKNELVQIFGNPALVGSEKLEDYNKLLGSISSAIKPVDIVGRLLTDDVTYWSWEIQRERKIKAEAIKHFTKEVVADLLKLALNTSSQLEATTYRIFFAGNDLALWSSDPKMRKQIEDELAAKGYDATHILAQAYMRGANQIDAIDRRIAFHTQLRNAALKEAGYWNDRIEQKLNQAVSDIIDAEFTETAGQANDDGSTDRQQPN